MSQPVCYILRPSMEFIHQAVDLFLHLDKHLNAVIQNYGVWTYAILFLIIFCETGLVACWNSMPPESCRLPISLKLTS